MRAVKVVLSISLCLNPYSNGICSLRKASGRTMTEKNIRLNPYSNGICSLSLEFKTMAKAKFGLNPYSNGICSLRQ